MVELEVSGGGVVGFLETSLQALRAVCGGPAGQIMARRILPNILMGFQGCYGFIQAVLHGGETWEDDLDTANLCWIMAQLDWTIKMFEAED